MSSFCKIQTKADKNASCAGNSAKHVSRTRTSFGLTSCQSVYVVKVQLRCRRQGNGPTLIWPTLQPTDQPTESDRKIPRHPIEKLCNGPIRSLALGKKNSMMPSDRIENSDRKPFYPLKGRSVGGLTRKVSHSGLASLFTCGWLEAGQRTEAHLANRLLECKVARTNKSYSKNVLCIYLTPSPTNRAFYLSRTIQFWLRAILSFINHKIIKYELKHFFSQFSITIISLFVFVISLRYKKMCSLFNIFKFVFRR